MQEYITQDLQDSPAQVITLQEASDVFLKSLEKAPPKVRGPGSVSYSDMRKRKVAHGMQPVGYWTVKGKENGPSVAVAASKSLAHGIRTDRFILHYGGYFDG